MSLLERLKGTVIGVCVHPSISKQREGPFYCGIYPITDPLIMGKLVNEDPEFIELCPFLFLNSGIIPTISTSFKELEETYDKVREESKIPSYERVKSFNELFPHLEKGERYTSYILSRKSITGIIEEIQLDKQFEEDLPKDFYYTNFFRAHHSGILESLRYKEVNGKIVLCSKLPKVIAEDKQNILTS